MTGYLEAPDNESLQAIAVFFNKYLSGDNLVVTVRYEFVFFIYFVLIR